jgi:hypothetical protein
LLVTHAVDIHQKKERKKERRNEEGKERTK